MMNQYEKLILMSSFLKENFLNFFGKLFLVEGREEKIFFFKTLKSGAILKDPDNSNLYSLIFKRAFQYLNLKNCANFWRKNYVTRIYRIKDLLHSLYFLTNLIIQETLLNRHSCKSYYLNPALLSKYY